MAMAVPGNVGSNDRSAGKRFSFSLHWPLLRTKRAGSQTKSSLFYDPNGEGEPAPEKKFLKRSEWRLAEN